ncbi:hypothetical protein AB0F92_07725 [Kitasatospora aureofaciens]|uniref:hypothetical protein n=1 Tax=Kitasatospora aureofaciens TaxID=1894 RepID=UPI00296F569F
MLLLGALGRASPRGPENDLTGIPAAGWRVRHRPQRRCAPSTGIALASYSIGSPHEVRRNGNAVTVTDPFGTHVLPGIAGKPAEELHIGGTHHHPYQTPMAQTKK